MSRSPAHEVVASRELSLGSHIATPRGGYVHHGIYVGNGLVVHYGGLVRGLRAGPIEVVSLEQFTHGRPLHVILASSPYFSGAEIVQRALSRVGEDRYHVLTNNCEHFCEWCVRAEQRSYQVDRWLSWPLRVVRRAIDVEAKLVNLVERLKPLHASCGSIGELLFESWSATSAVPRTDVLSERQLRVGTQLAL